jgi:hypothetical protein
MVAAAFSMVDFGAARKLNTLLITFFIDFRGKI